MDTKLLYFGRLRQAAYCGSLRGRNVYSIEMGPTPIRVLVRDSAATNATQAKCLFMAGRDTDIEALTSIEWAGNQAAIEAKAWIAEECSKRSAKLVALLDSLRVTTEVSPS